MLLLSAAFPPLDVAAAESCLRTGSGNMLALDGQEARRVGVFPTLSFCQKGEFASFSDFSLIYPEKIMFVNFKL